MIEVEPSGDEAHQGMFVPLNQKTPTKTQLQGVVTPEKASKLSASGLLGMVNSQYLSASDTDDMIEVEPSGDEAPRDALLNQKTPN
jgi:hypothetical protein